MTFKVIREPSGEWQFGIWYRGRPMRSLFSVRLFKRAFVWEWR